MQLFAVDGMVSEKVKSPQIKNSGGEDVKMDSKSFFAK